MKSNDDTRIIGQKGENLAVAALEREKYTILKRNMRLGRYEIDIVAQEGDTIVFVEVKTRQDDVFSLPEENVTEPKMENLRQAARMYIEQQDEPERYYRFDVVSVVLGQGHNTEVRIIRNAFEDR